MTEEDILHNEQELGKFFNRERKRNIAFLRKRYSFSLVDAEDIFQDACLAMFKNIQDGKLVTLTSRLSTYFTQICNFQALKRVRDVKPMDSTDEIQYDADKVDELMGLDGGFTVGQQQAMEELIKFLPAPCNDILWSYYYDNKSMAEIAQVINFSNANSVKAKKSQCMSKLKDTYSEFIKDLMYGK